MAEKQERGTTYGPMAMRNKTKAYWKEQAFAAILNLNTH